MRILKLVIWDLDETLLTGILEEGDKEVDPVASMAMRQLNDRGILQALATQNRPEMISEAMEEWSWAEAFVSVEADLGSKASKVRRILDKLNLSPLDTVFVDNDPFEQASIAAQFSGVTSWSVAELAAHLTETNESLLTEEARRRPQMYREQQVRAEREEATGDYDEFLRSCNITINIRGYVPEDALRARELLTRTHQINLGVLPVEEAVARLNRTGEHHIIVAEMKDVYGDMGRCGIIHLTPISGNGALIESLAISCRTRARGVALALLVGLLRNPELSFSQYCCRYISNGSNLPLRMLLMNAGFKPRRGTDQLVLDSERLDRIVLPNWVNITYPQAYERTR